MIPSSADFVPDPFHPKAEQASRGSAQIGSTSDSSLNLDQIFQLIDRVLPFEVCLYHQLLPLSLKNDQLTLGMVDLTDQSAIDYIRPMLSFIHCDLTPQHLTAEAHSAVLSAYLSYSGKQTSGKTDTAVEPSVATGIQSDRPQPDRLMADPSNNPTLLVDSPIYLLEQEGYLPKSSPTQKFSASTNGSSSSSKVTNHLPKTALNHSESSQPQNLTKLQQEPAFVITEDPQLALSLKSKFPSLSLDQLLYLAPPDLLQELLVRVLTSGIGRLYFEQQPNYGRILWSQDGKVQEILQEAASDCIAPLIEGLKQLTHTPISPINSLHQVEIERFYQGERLLLRLRLMPGSYGEEATLQILRGTALRFYQQQQLENLGRDALGMAQQLQSKIDELRNQTDRHPQMANDQLTMLPALDQVIQRIETQLAALKTVRTHPSLAIDLEKTRSTDSN
jgi:type II secretory ATPase GspE/PulE/Tfp pilus assembly ATPase PilB-like protein